MRKWNTNKIRKVAACLLLGATLYATNTTNVQAEVTEQTPDQGTEVEDLSNAKERGDFTISLNPNKAVERGFEHSDFEVYYKGQKLTYNVDYFIHFYQNNKGPLAPFEVKSGEVTVRLRMHRGALEDKFTGYADFIFNISSKETASEPVPEPSKPVIIDPDYPIDMSDEITDIGEAYKKEIIYAKTNADDYFTAYYGEGNKRNMKVKPKATLFLTDDLGYTNSGFGIGYNEKYHQLVKGVDYTVSIKVTKRRELCRMYVTFKGINNYTGEFTITDYVQLVVVDHYWNSKTVRINDAYYGKIPTIDVYTEYYKEYKDKNGVIRKKKTKGWIEDYYAWYSKKSLSGKRNRELLIKEFMPAGTKITYQNYKKAGTGKMTIEGTGRGLGKVTLTFKIKRAPLPECYPFLYYNSETGRYWTHYGSGLPIKPDVSFKGDSSTKNEFSYLINKVRDAELKRNKDYKIIYKNNVGVGKATMTVQGIGNYKGKKTFTFYII